MNDVYTVKFRLSCQSFFGYIVLYVNIDQILPNKLNGQMHYSRNGLHGFTMDTCYMLCCDNMTV